MTNTQNRDELFDEFETWLRSCPPTKPPDDLRARCLRTVPSEHQTRAVFTFASYRNVWREHRVKLVGGLSLLAASIVVVCFLAQGPESVFAAAIRKSAAAPAVHFVETFSELEREPGSVRSSEWWIVRGIGKARVLKTDGQVTRRIVWHKSEVTNWNLENNEVSITPTSHPVDRVAGWLTDADTLRDYEKKAKEQGIPIKVDKVAIDGREIRRVRIVDLIVTEQDDTKQKMTLIVDIDDSTNRIVRKWSHLSASGPNRENFASLNSVHEFVIDYPDAKSIDRSIFKLDYPADAKVTRSKTLEE